MIAAITTATPDRSIGNARSVLTVQTDRLKLASDKHEGEANPEEKHLTWVDLTWHIYTLNVSEGISSDHHLFVWIRTPEGTLEWRHQVCNKHSRRCIVSSVCLSLGTPAFTLLVNLVIERPIWTRSAGACGRCIQVTSSFLYYRYICCVCNCHALFVVVLLTFLCRFLTFEALFNTEGAEGVTAGQSGFTTTHRVRCGCALL